MFLMEDFSISSFCGEIIRARSRRTDIHDGSYPPGRPGYAIEIGREIAGVIGPGPVQLGIVRQRHPGCCRVFQPAVCGGLIEIIRGVRSVRCVPLESGVGLIAGIVEREIVVNVTTEAVEISDDPENTGIRRCRGIEIISGGIIEPVKCPTGQTAYSQVIIPREIRPTADIESPIPVMSDIDIVVVKAGNCGTIQGGKTPPPHISISIVSIAMPDGPIADRLDDPHVCSAAGRAARPGHIFDQHAIIPVDLDQVAVALIVYYR